MPEIDLGLEFGEVKDEDKFDPMPLATYEFQILSYEMRETQSGKNAGRPGISWVLAVINHSEFTGRQVFYNTPLPWEKDGQRDISGIGFLVALAKAVKREWTGGKITPEEYVGLIGEVALKQKAKQELNPETQKYEDTDEIINVVKKFVY